MNPLWFIPLFVLSFIGIWFLVTRVLRVKSGMGTVLNVEPGRQLRESNWGSAVINGVRARNCVKLIEYIEGWELRMMSMLGGGRLWIPKEDVHLSAPEQRDLFGQRMRTITSGEHTVRLIGGLAGFLPGPHSETE
jgi:hypothetical protein